MYITLYRILSIYCYEFSLFKDTIKIKNPGVHPHIFQSKHYNYWILNDEPIIVGF